MHYVLDIDGVIADVTHLLPLIDQQLPIELREYAEYYRRIGEAKPIQAGIDLYNHFKNHKVTYITGRSECCRDVTFHWIMLNTTYHYGYDKQLLMRPDGDERPAHDVKRDLFLKWADKNAIDPKQCIAIDDDKQVCKMYRELGLTVLHVSSDVSRSQ